MESRLYVKPVTLNVYMFGCFRYFTLYFHHRKSKKQRLLYQNMPDDLSNYAKVIIFHTVLTGYLVCGMYNNLEWLSWIRWWSLVVIDPTRIISQEGMGLYCTKKSHISKFSKLFVPDVLSLNAPIIILTKMNGIYLNQSVHDPSRVIVSEIVTFIYIYICNLWSKASFTPTSFIWQFPLCNFYLLV